MNSLTFVGKSSTRNTIKHLSALLSLAILVAACDGNASSPTSAIPTAPSPTAPTPTAPSPPTPTPTVTYTLFGAVWEMMATGSAPVEGARVADTATGRHSVTDANGLYSLPGLPAMSRSLAISKAGYLTETKTVTMSEDTQLDIRLERTVSSVLSGVAFEITEEGRVPIEGVEVYCDSCGSPVGHTFVYTDANGFYSLAWTNDGVHLLFVTKAGYGVISPDGTVQDAHGRISATVHGDTRFDIELARR